MAVFEESSGNSRGANGIPSSILMAAVEEPQREQVSRETITNNSSLAMRLGVTGEPGKITCYLCDQSLAGNANSMDVHVKNHLNYKPHQCGYCEYRSCIPGKVKRHLDTVHRGLVPSTLSFTQTSNVLKQILLDVKVICFPYQSGASDLVGANVTLKKSKSELLELLEEYRVRLSDEVQNLMGAASGLGTEPGALELRSSTPSAVSLVSGHSSSGNLQELFNENEESGSSSAGSPGKLGGLGGLLPQQRIVCQVCQTQVADNPSSIGLHVRNHLDYKPFRCKLCSYRSCIQAKVKRHLKNVHKLQRSDELVMTYEPDAEIRNRVSEMRRRCFPKMTVGDGVVNMIVIDPSSSEKESKLGVINQISERRNVPFASYGNFRTLWKDMLTTKTKSDQMGFVPVEQPVIDENSNVDVSHQNYEENNNESLMDFDDDSVTCQLCYDDVTNEPVAKSEHLVKHVQRSQKSLSPAEYDRLLNQCFPPTTTGIENGAEQVILLNANGDSCDQSALAEGITCNLCWALINCQVAAVRQHVQEHMNTPHYRCPHCETGFVHRDAGIVKDHIRTTHEDLAPMKMAFLAADPGGSEAQWVHKCFPNLDLEDLEPPLGGDELLIDEADSQEDEEEDNVPWNDSVTDQLDERDDVTTKTKTKDGPRYICQLCKLPVSIYASSLYTHVKNHMNYKPYACPHCDYCSPVKSKVRRHLQHAHKGVSIKKIIYNPKLGIEQDILRLKRRCFPDVAGLNNSPANAKLPCHLCQTDVADTPLSRTVHAKNHLNAKPFHCGHCAYKSCLKGETRRHVNRQHVGAPMLIHFEPNDQADSEQVELMIKKCFFQPPLEQNRIVINRDLEVMLEEDSRGLEELRRVGKTKKVENNLSLNFMKAGQAFEGAMEGEMLLEEDHERIGKVRKTGETSMIIKLGQAFREWHCPYCAFSATSKYVVKNHCLLEHPGQPLEASDAPL